MLQGMMEILHKNLIIKKKQYRFVLQILDDFQMNMKVNLKIIFLIIIL